MDQCGCASLCAVAADGFQPRVEPGDLYSVVGTLCGFQQSLHLSKFLVAIQYVFYGGSGIGGSLLGQMGDDPAHRAGAVAEDESGCLARP